MKSRFITKHFKIDTLPKIITWSHFKEQIATVITVDYGRR